MRFVLIAALCVLSSQSFSMTQILCGSMLYVIDGSKLKAFNRNFDNESFSFQIKTSSSQEIYAERICSYCDGEPLLSISLKAYPSINKTYKNEHRFEVKEVMKDKYLDLRKKETEKQGGRECSST